MKIAVVGAGNTGCSLAGFYSRQGHEVTLIKTSHAVHDDNFSYLQEHEGLLEMDHFGTVYPCRIQHLSRDVQDIQGKDLVLLCTQTVVHRDVIEKLAPFLSAGQILMINPGYLSSAYVLQLCHTPGIIIVETQSTFIDGRIIRPGYFKVGFENVLNPVGIYPHYARRLAIEKLETLGTPFEYLGSVIEAALHNPNMIVHTVGAIMSIPRIEATGGDYCMYHEVFTPSVWNILEALDSEKMAVLKALGYEPLSYVDACKKRNSLDKDIDGKKVFFEYAAMPTRAKGPTSVDSRYICEDVPEGLVMLESLGHVLNIPTPVASSLICLASAALKRDFRRNGRTLDRLGNDCIRAIIRDSRQW